MQRVGGALGGDSAGFGDFVSCLRAGARPDLEDSFLESPAYYVLTGRRDAWIYKGYGSALVSCLHPHRSDRILVFPEIGESDGRLCAGVLNALTPPKGGVQLARFSKADLLRVRDRLYESNASRVESLSPIEENSLDWRYPAHILDTRKVRDLNGAAFQKARGKLRRLGQAPECYSLEDPCALRIMRSAAKFWEGSMIFREKDEGDISSFYETLFTMIAHWPDMFGGCAFVRNGRPCGFVVWDVTPSGTANLLASLGEVSITGFSEYQIVESCRMLSERGIRTLNFGGSETEDLDRFKRKFAPIRSVSVGSADVKYQVLPDGIEVQSFVPDAVRSMAQSSVPPL